jgi:hypothetical protein
MEIHEKMDLLKFNNFYFNLKENSTIQVRFTATLATKSATKYEPFGRSYVSRAFELEENI